MKIALVSRSTLYKQPGGDSVQIARTALGLEALGHEIHIVLAGQPLPKNIDILHGFNLGRPADLLPYFNTFKGPKLLSTIYVDYGLADELRAPQLYRLLGSFGMEWLKTVLRGLNKSDRFPSLGYVVRGQRRSMNALLKNCDALITSSMSEFERITSWSALEGKKLRDKHIVLPLGIADEFIEEATQSDHRSGLLMVGRLEYLKNQLSIIEWATERNWPLTVVGSANTNQQEYYDACRKAAGPTVNFLPYTPAEGIINLMDTHQCLVIPSLFESYSLVGWEAASRGMHVIANKVADMSETLEPFATLVSMDQKQAFIEAVEQGLKAQKKSQVAFNEYTWDSITKRLERIYGNY